MKLMAVICEYNPFHNGHAHQLTVQRKQLACDGVLCLMSCSFVQRGEPAICDKWARAEMALAAGCDLVLELPVLYSLQSAEGFANGAVSLLTQLGFDGYLCFGSESGDLAALEAVAALEQAPAYHQALRAHLATGVSYPKACSLAAEQLLPCAGMLTERPNDLLGIAYIRALQNSGSLLKPQAIRREHGAHDTLEPDGCFLSATGLRERLLAGEAVAPYMPAEAYEILQREIQAGRCPVTADGLDMLICYALGRMDAATLSAISGVSEGLENRLLEAAKAQRSFQGLAAAAKTKRYPLTRINRVLLCALLGITKADEALMPAYARILGIGERGGAILRQLQQTTQIPLMNKTADATLNTKAAKRLFALETAATDVYSLLYPQKKAGRSDMDYSRSPVIRLAETR